MANATTSNPLHIQAGKGEAHWWFGGAAQIKLDADRSGGHLSVVEVLVPEGAGPLHVHHGEDEGFWILDGYFRFQVGDETFEAEPGDFVWGPRDVPHGFECLRGPGRIVYLFTPGGFERFIRETGERAQGLEMPPAGRGGVDPGRLVPALERARAEILS